MNEFFKIYPKAALGFSGGVDSSYLLYEARRLGADVKPYFVKSEFQPDFELADAYKAAAFAKAELTVLPLDVLALRDVADNTRMRCYHCKKVIVGAIKRAALIDGYTVLLDGCNASDDADDRPGMLAARELGVMSPLREAGLTKADIRRLSREAGLFTHDKPAYACLATRIPHGTVIRAETLREIERAESALSEMGFTDLRVRTRDGGAKLQVRGEQMPLVLEKRREILSALGGFGDILLDLRERT